MFKAFASALLFVVLAAAGAQAENPSAGGPASLKERLSDKASDAQRVNNCRVPPDRRGPMPRPDCPPSASGGDDGSSGGKTSAGSLSVR